MPPFLFRAIIPLQPDGFDRPMIGQDQLPGNEFPPKSKGDKEVLGYVGLVCTNQPSQRPHNPKRSISQSPYPDPELTDILANRTTAVENGSSMLSKPLPLPRPLRLSLIKKGRKVSLLAHADARTLTGPPPYSSPPPR